MKESSRRRYLQAVGVGAAGVASATAGCSALDGLTGGGAGGSDYRSLVAHSDWFDPGESSVVTTEPDPMVVYYRNETTIRSHAESVADWIVESADGMFGLDAKIDRHAMAMLPRRAYFLEYVDAESLRTAAMENDDYEPVSDFDGYRARVGDGTVTVAGDGSVLGLVLPEDLDANRYDDDELAASAARLHEKRPSKFAAGTDRLERFDRLLEAVGPSTIGRFELRYTSEYNYPRVEAFTVGSERTELRVAAIGDDLDPETLERRELELYGSAYEPYDDLEATSSNGLPMLQGSVPTEEFDLLSSD